MAVYFGVYSIILTLTVVAGILRFLAEYKTKTMIGLALWLTYGGILSYLGVLADLTVKPSPLIFLLAPIVAWILFITRTRCGKTLALSLPIQILIGLQVFRVGVEIFLVKLWELGQVPQMMTYHGANFDIFVGLSAPLVAYLLSKNLISNKIAILWNWVGIAILVNVVGRGILTTPGIFNFLKDDFPNTAIVTFPFTYIAILMVPLAISLHIFSIRNLWASAPN